MGEGLKRAAKAAKATRGAPRRTASDGPPLGFGGDFGLPPDTDLEKTLRRENASLRESIADLQGQIRRHAESHVISPSELESIAEQGRAFRAMKAEQDEIAFFLRMNYSEEINAGRHSGRPLSEILISYLGELRAFKRGPQ